MTKRFHLLQIIWVCFEAEWKTHTLNRPSSSAYCRGSFHLGDLFDTLKRNDSIEQIEGFWGVFFGCVRVWFEDPWSGHTGCYWAHFFILFIFLVLFIRIEILSFAGASSHFRCFFYYVMYEYNKHNCKKKKKKVYTKKNNTIKWPPPKKNKTKNNPKSFNEVNYNKQQTRCFKLCMNKWSLQLQRLLRCVRDSN